MPPTPIYNPNQDFLIFSRSGFLDIWNMCLDIFQDFDLKNDFFENPKCPVDKNGYIPIYNEYIL